MIAAGYLAWSAKTQQENPYTPNSSFARAAENPISNDQKPYTFDSYQPGEVNPAGRSVKWIIIEQDNLPRWFGNQSETTRIITEFSLSTASNTFRTFFSIAGKIYAKEADFSQKGIGGVRVFKLQLRKILVHQKKNDKTKLEGEIE
jgi:hypothetical protein